MPDSLHGVRVLDLSRVLAGPYAAQMLGDLGADVIKVERPGKGDDTRHWGPPWAQAQDGRRAGASYFHSCNRNKRSLTLDFRKARGRAVLQRLFAWADIVIENYKLGDLERFGLDHASVRRRHPQLIWCSITGFGHSGPEAQRSGYDMIAEAESGLMDITGADDGPPMKVGVAVADLTTGMMSVTAILAALHHRGNGNPGQHIDMALFDSTLGWLANQASGWLVGGVEPVRLGNQHPSVVPQQDFATATQPIVLAVANDRQFALLAEALGQAQWASDPDFATSAARAENRARLVPQIAALLQTQPADHWLALFAARQIPAGRIASVRQALESPQARAHNLVVEQPHAELGMVRTVAQPLALATTPPSYRLPPPLLGEHSRAILEELGLAPAEITELFAAGVSSAA